MSDIQLRLCTEEDLPNLCQIEQRSFSTPWSKESFCSALASKETEIWVLTDENEQILGFGCVIVVADQGEILNIAVAPLYRRKGYGEILLQTLLDSANNHGAEQVFLEVRESNTAARYLYEKKGFLTIGKRKRYYTNPTEDAVCMCCSLQKYSNN